MSAFSSSGSSLLRRERTKSIDNTQPPQEIDRNALKDLFIGRSKGIQLKKKATYQNKALKDCFVGEYRVFLKSELLFVGV